MYSKLRPGLVLLSAFGLAYPAAVTLAQQPRPSAATPVARGYFSRVQTRADASVQARRGVRGNATPSLYDPVRPYGDETRTAAGAGDTPRPYERAPVVSPPVRSAPAPPASHNYFPGMRTGQATNSNTARCVPGRRSFLSR
jgi:hypothetical protein